MLPLSRKRVDRDSLQITASSPSTDAKWDKELSAYNRSKRTENKPKSNIKDLEEQLEELRLDHERLKFTHGQLLASLDSDMDRRRVSLLKLQNIQLERQIVALNEQLERRHHGWMLMENLLSRLEDSKGNEDLAEIKNVMRHIDGNHRLLERELSIPFEFMGLFSSQRRIDFRQLCSGKLDHVSISQCSRLESDLHELWSKLKTISSVPKDVIETMERVLQQLLDLSLIVPSSPDIPAIKVGQGLAEALTSLRQIINGSIKQVNARQKAVRELQRLEALFNVSHREPSPKHTSEVASRPHYHQTEIDA